MLQVELRVNGEVVGRGTLINRGCVEGGNPLDRDGERYYDWSYFVVDEDKEFHGTLTHARRDGAEALASSMLIDVFFSSHPSCMSAIIGDEQ